MTRTSAIAAGLWLIAAAMASTTAYAENWKKNDPERPQPPSVVPRGAVLGMAAPSDATVLFDGSNLDAWNVPAASGWSIRDGTLIPGGRVFNNMMSKARFGDIQLHLEFREPSPPRGKGQERGNSGVFLMGRFEIQIVDPIENPTYADGTMAAIYGETPPLVIAARRSGQWQSLDIYFEAPHANGASVTAPAYVTVVLNGVLVHNHQVIHGDTGSKATSPPSYLTAATDGPIGLQDHGSPTTRVAFRQIWVRPLGKSADER